MGRNAKLMKRKTLKEKQALRVTSAAGGEKSSLPSPTEKHELSTKTFGGGVSKRPTQPNPASKKALSNAAEALMAAAESARTLQTSKAADADGDVSMSGHNKPKTLGRGSIALKNGKGNTRQGKRDYVDILYGTKTFKPKSR